MVKMHAPPGGASPPLQNGKKGKKKKTGIKIPVFIAKRNLMELGDFEVFNDERDFFGHDVIAFTIEGADLPRFGPAIIEVPTTEFATGIVIKRDGDVATDILTSFRLVPPFLQVGCDDVTFLEGDITEFSTTRTFTERQIIAILEFDDFEFAVDTIDTFEVTSGYAIDIDFEVVSTNVIQICTTTRHSLSPLVVS